MVDNKDNHLTISKKIIGGCLACIIFIAGLLLINGIVLTFLGQLGVCLIY